VIEAADKPTTALASNPSKEDVLYLLKPRAGMTGPQVVANEALARSMGEKAYPALAEALAETSDPILVLTILRTMTDSEGDKKAPFAAAKKLLERFQGDEPNAPVIRVAAVRAMGEMARPEDRELLFPLLEDRDEGVRLTAWQMLERLCYVDEGDRLQAYYARRAKLLTPAELDSDPTLREARKVIVSVELTGRLTTATLVNGWAHLTTMPAFLLPGPVPTPLPSSHVGR
jgi:HEAT repeat protein